MKAVNLIPVEQRGGAGPAGGRSHGAAYAVLALLGGLALLVYLYGSAQHEISTRSTQLAVLNAQTARVEAGAAQLAPYTTFITTGEQREQTVTELAQSRFDWPRLLEELGRVLPSTTTITSLSGAVGSPTSTGSAAAKGSSAVASATPPGSVPVITLTGCSTSQSDVAQDLNRLRLIDGVTAATLQSSTLGGSGGGSTGGGGCQPSDPAFAVTITFEPLPATSSSGSAAVTAPTSSGGVG